MIALARPGFLIAGALLALVPLALHFLARRPLRPEPLPTIRFLPPSDHSALRFRRRPTDIALLVLRMLLLLVLGAAFAGPSWSPPRRGTTTIVLLDAQSPAAGIDSARALLSAGDGALIVFDSAAATFTGDGIDAALDSLTMRARTEPSLGAAASDRALPRSSYAAAFAELAAARGLLPAAESARVVLVTVPRWRAWDDGVAAARAAWPGGVRVISLATPHANAPGPDSSARSGTAHASGEGSVYVAAALEAIGYRIVDATEGADVIVVPQVDTAAALRAGERARAGATVVLAGPAAVMLAGPAALAAGEGETLDAQVHTGAPDRVRQLTPTPIDIDGVLVTGAAARVPLREPDDARVVARWLDGRPAAFARRAGAGCIVTFGAPLMEGALPRDPAFPTLVDRLVHGCEPGTDADEAGSGTEPLDAGAFATLRGTDGAVALAALPGDAAGAPLGRIAVIVALIIAGTETWLAYRRTPPIK